MTWPTILVGCVLMGLSATSGAEIEPPAPLPPVLPVPTPEQLVWEELE